MVMSMSLAQLFLFPRASRELIVQCSGVLRVDIGRRGGAEPREVDCAYHRNTLQARNAEHMGPRQMVSFSEEYEGRLQWSQTL